jgi:protein DJ-1
MACRTPSLFAFNNTTQSNTVQALLKHYDSKEKWIATICAAAIALPAAHIAKQRRITSHPSVKDDLAHAGWTNYSEDRVVIDGTLPFAFDSLSRIRTCRVLS